MSEEPLWTIDEAAKYIGKSTSWLYKAVASGEVPCARIGHSVRFLPTQLKEWVHSRVHKGEA